MSNTYTNITIYIEPHSAGDKYVLNFFKKNHVKYMLRSRNLLSDSFLMLKGGNSNVLKSYPLILTEFEQDNVPPIESAFSQLEAPTLKDLRNFLKVIKQR